MDQLLSHRILLLESQWKRESGSRPEAGPRIELEVHMMAEDVTVINIDFFVETVGIGRGRRMGGVPVYPRTSCTVRIL